MHARTPFTNGGSRPFRLSLIGSGSTGVEGADQGREPLRFRFTAGNRAPLQATIPRMPRDHLLDHRQDGTSRPLPRGPPPAVAYEIRNSLTRLTSEPRIRCARRANKERRPSARARARVRPRLVLPAIAARHFARSPYFSFCGIIAFRARLRREMPVCLCVRVFGTYVSIYVYLRLSLNVEWGRGGRGLERTGREKQSS